MLIYDKPKKAFLHNDLYAYESEENDRQLIYHFKKGLRDRIRRISKAI